MVVDAGGDSCNHSDSSYTQSRGETLLETQHVVLWPTSARSSVSMCFSNVVAVNCVAVCSAISDISWACDVAPAFICSARLLVSFMKQALLPEAPVI